ncbi:MAG: dihydrolipoyllysine-residue acetyltransferase [Betaproteobacteria bacterium]|jgi:pyruvate dehydrogenase E2 component (dihydrolipoamide acetyltransferase)|nr:MAG: dihydrolipoyllysine-residue acetyltransferase [Betaproteobacteria bacterium]
MASLKNVLVPDIGDFKDVPIIEVLVKPGDAVSAEDSLITLESDKATMEVPAPFGGIVKEMKVKVGDTVSEGATILTIEAGADGESAEGAPAVKPAPVAEPAAVTEPAPPVAPATEPAKPSAQQVPPPPTAAAPAASRVDEGDFVAAHASPGVRRFARELGADLGKIKGSGPKGRILKEDVQAFVKSAISGGASAAAPTGAGLALGLPAWPMVDFAKFGPVQTNPLSRIKKISGPALHRNWAHIPHVTQNDEADITELEAFRKSMAKEAENAKVRLTPLVFIMKATVAALKQHPEFNASLSPDADALIVKGYYHIGVAVDTPGGLVVPVVRDVDKKGVLQLAGELAKLSAKARDGKLGPAEMQGGTFSISSLGGIGGGHFTPIINAPEVAILGVARAVMKPVWDGQSFQPRLMLPLSLSYDHRVIDGAQGARFISYLNGVLSDMRRMLL